MPWSGIGEQLLLDRLDRGTRGGAAGERVVEVDAGQVEAHREDRGEPADGAGQIGAGHHLLLAAVALEADQRVRGVDARGRAATGQRQRSAVSRPSFDAAVERLRARVVSSASVTSAGTSHRRRCSTVAVDVDRGSSGRDPSSGSAAVEHPPPQFELGGARSRARPRRGRAPTGASTCPTGAQRRLAARRRSAPTRSRGRGPGSARTRRRPPGGGRRPAAGPARRPRVEPDHLHHARPAAGRAGRPPRRVPASRSRRTRRRSRRDRDPVQHASPSHRAVGLHLHRPLPARRGRRQSRARSMSWRSSTACERARQRSSRRAAAGSVSSTAWEKRRKSPPRSSIHAHDRGQRHLADPAAGQFVEHHGVRGAVRTATSASPATVLRSNTSRGREHHPGGLRAGDQLDRHDAVAAESEERVVDTDRVEAEHLGEQIRRGSVSVSVAGARPAGHPRPEVRFGQRLRSSLPFAVSGSASSTTTAAGTMYDGSCAADERRATARRVDGGAGSGHHVADQPVAAVPSSRTTTTACATPRQREQRRLRSRRVRCGNRAP